MQSKSPSKRAESVRKRKAVDSQPESGQEPNSESLLTSSAAEPKTKKQANEDDEHPLLDKISQTLKETKKTSPKIASKHSTLVGLIFRVIRSYRGLP